MRATQIGQWIDAKLSETYEMVVRADTPTLILAVIVGLVIVQITRAWIKVYQHRDTRAPRGRHYVPTIGPSQSPPFDQKQAARLIQALLRTAQTIADAYGMDLDDESEEKPFSHQAEHGSVKVNEDKMSEQVITEMEITAYNDDTAGYAQRIYDQFDSDPRFERAEITFGENPTVTIFANNQSLKHDISKFVEANPFDHGIILFQIDPTAKKQTVRLEQQQGHKVLRCPKCNSLRTIPLYSSPVHSRICEKCHHEFGPKLPDFLPKQAESYPKVESSGPILDPFQAVSIDARTERQPQKAPKTVEEALIRMREDNKASVNITDLRRQTGQ